MTSSTRYFINRSCRHKNKYPSLKKALIYLFKSRQRDNTVNSCYKCVVCGFWHLGHYPVNHRSRLRCMIKKYLKERKKNYM